MVFQGVGIHREHPLAQEYLVLVGQGDLGDLRGEIVLEALAVFLGVVGGEFVAVVEQVGSALVVGVELVVAVDFRVDALAQGGIEVVFG